MGRASSVHQAPVWTLGGYQDRGLWCNRLWFRAAGARVSIGPNYSGYVFSPWHLPSNNKSTDVLVLIRLYHDICRHFTCLCLQMQPRNRLIFWALSCARGLRRAMSQLQGNSVGAVSPAGAPQAPPLDGPGFSSSGGGGGGSWVFSSILFSVRVWMPEKSPCLRILVYPDLVGRATSRQTKPACVCDALKRPRPAHGKPQIRSVTCWEGGPGDGEGTGEPLPAAPFSGLAGGLQAVVFLNTKC